jgi:hypothetical protein
MSSKQTVRRTLSRLTVEELEQLTPQELSELLARIVLVLRRLPDVPLNTLQAGSPVPAESGETESLDE